LFKHKSHPGETGETGIGGRTGHQEQAPSSSLSLSSSTAIRIKDKLNAEGGWGVDLVWGIPVSHFAASLFVL